MRKVIFEIAVSLDGFVEGPNGELDWLVKQNARRTSRLASRFDTIFYGRVAYEKLGLPRPTNAFLHVSEREYNQTMNTMRKFVFSRHLKHVAGQGMMVNGNLVSEVKRLRDEDGKDIWLCGGPDILKTFMGLDFIDEYVLSVHPVILGSGKRLFQNLGTKMDLTCLGASRLSSGVVMLRYKPAASKSKIKP